MNHQHYSPISEPLVKRRRGRPRKEDSLSYLSKLPPIKPPASMGTQVFILNQTTESNTLIPPFQPQADLSKGKAQVENTNSNGGVINGDEMIGKAITGVLDGKFDAGYLLSVVKVGENDTLMRGVVFQPGKFVPVTKDNDIAPGVKMYTRVDQGCTVDSVPEKIEEEKVVDLEADKVLDPAAIVAEKSSVAVPNALMEAENGDEENVVMPEKKNEGLEPEDEKVVINKDYGSPSLELALSNTSFGDTQVVVEAVEKNLTVDENQLKIPMQNLEPCLDSSLMMKDVLKMSIDVGESNEDFGEGNKVADLPIVVPSICNLEEIEPGQEDRAAKKQKIDENVEFSEVVSVIQSGGVITPKEPADNQGFNNGVACLNKPMETD